LLCGVGSRPRWGIRQKQTGADRRTLDGAVAANIHGRVLTSASAPFSIRSVSAIVGLVVIVVLPSVQGQLW
jgi:hypothetical protein